MVVPEGHERVKRGSSKTLRLREELYISRPRKYGGRVAGRGADKRRRVPARRGRKSLSCSSKKQGRFAEGENTPESKVREVVKGTGFGDYLGNGGKVGKKNFW